MSAIPKQGKLSRSEKVIRSLEKGNGVTRVSVPSYHHSNEVTVYEVDVSNKKLRWNLWLRYECFYNLHQAMQQLVEDLASTGVTITLPPFPEKQIKFLTDHLDENFVENRRVLLENYLVRLLHNRHLRCSEMFIKFLTPDVEDDNSGAGLNADPNQDSNVDNSPCANGSSTKKSGEEEKESSNSTTNDDKKTTKSRPHSTKSTNGKTDNAGDNTPTDTNDNTEDDTLLIMDLEAISAMYTRVPMEDIDETDEITDVSIPLAQILRNRHTIYHIHLVNCNNRKSFSEWVVLKRYHDLANFHDELCQVVEQSNPTVLEWIPTLPPKHWKLFTDHFSEEFIEKRRILLQNYLQRLLKHKVFRRLDITLDFFQVGAY